MNRSDWLRTEIQSVYLGLYDGPHATPKSSDDGPVFLGIKNLTDDGRLDLSETRHISEDDFPKWIKRVTPQAGDIVFTYEATLGRYAIIPKGFRGCLGRRLALIRPDPHKADGRFLHYYFFGDQWRRTVAQNTNIGSTVDRIPLTKFPRFEISLPSLLEQRRIASILSAYDDLIDNNLRRIKILEEMAQNLYREWFVKFRFPGYEKVKMVDSELGKVPEGWAVCKFSDAIELVYGKALKQSDRIPGPIPVYGSSGIVGYHNESLTEGPGIILGRKGNVGSVHWSQSDFFAIDTVYYVRSALPLIFLFYNLQTQNFLNSDAAVPGLSRAQAYLLPFVVPDPGILRRFSSHAALMFAVAQVFHAQCDVLRRTRDLLLPRLISGELDVSELDIEVSEEAA